MVQHLLLAGSDLEAMMGLAARLHPAFVTTTIALTQDISGRLEARAADGRTAVIVCLDGRESPAEIEGLVRRARGAVFLVSTAATFETLRLAGAVVLHREEPVAVLLATLHAYSAPRGERVEKL